MMHGMSAEQTQPSLLIRVRNPADQAAWREFDQKYRGLILSYCQSRGLQASDAEDVRQIVMMNLTRFLPSFEYQPGKGKFRYYLGRTVRHAIAHYFSRPNRAAAGLDSAVLAGVPSPESESDDVWEQEWVRHHFRLAMEIVRETFEPRSVLIFDRLLAGAEPEAVAAEHQTTTAAVHKIKQRIRDRLKELIDTQVADEDAPRG